MKDWIDEIPIDDDWLLELLVDNELNDQQRRRLLDGLDGEPDGWRRCALAFLESQSCAGDLSAWVPDPGRAATPVERVKPGRLGRLSAVAAALLLAFALGTASRGWLGFGLPSATEIPETGTGLPSVARQGRDGKQAPEDVAVAPTQAPTPGRRPIGVVARIAPEHAGEDPRAIRAPVIDASQLDAQGISLAVLSIPPEVLTAMELTGHRIERRYGEEHLDLDDGRRVLVPFEETFVEPVSLYEY